MAGKQVVWSAGLDASKVLAALKQIVAGVQEVKDSLGQQFQVKIDTKQFDQLKAALAKGFRELGESFAQSMQDGTTKVVAQLGTIQQSIDQLAVHSEASLANALASGAQRGAAKAREEIAGAAAELSRFDDRVNNTVQSFVNRASKLGPVGQQTFLDTSQRKGIDIYDPEYFVKSDKKGDFVSPTATGDASRAISAAKELEKATLEADKAASKLQTDFEGAMSAGDRAFEVRQRTLAALEQQFRSASNRRDDRIDAGLGSDFSAAMNARDVSFARAQAPNAAAQASQAAAAARKIAIADLEKIRDTHKGIDGSIIANAANLARIVIAYRIMRDTIREIESLISGFIQSGIEYTKTLEDNEANLTGVLAANFKVVDAMGQQLEGAARLNALQQNSHDLYLKIAAAAQNTTATTKDLVGVYEALTEPAVRFGKSTQDVLGLTTQLVTAAKSLGISPTAAANQGAQILNGKGGTSALARGLGINASDIELLKGTPAIYDLLASHAQKFADANRQVDNSLSSVQKRFMDVIGPVSAQVEAPFFAQFKDFAQRAETFINSDAGKKFFATLGSAGQGVLGAAKSSTSGLFGNSADLNTFVTGLGKVIEGIVSIIGFVVTGTAKIVEFAGSHRTLIEAAALVYGLAKAWSFVTGLGASIQLFAAESGALNQVVGAMLAKFSLAAGGAKTLASEIEAASSQASTFRATMAGLGGGIVLASVAAFFGYVIVQLTDMAERWRLAKDAKDQYLAGDTQGSIATRQQQFRSAQSPEERAAAGQGIAQIAGDQFSALTSSVDAARKKFGLQSTDIAGAITELSDSNKQGAIAAASEIKQKIAEVITTAKAADELLGKSRKELAGIINEKNKSLPGADNTIVGGANGVVLGDRIRAEIAGATATGTHVQADHNKVQDIIDSLAEAPRSSVLKPAPSAPNIDFKKASFKDGTDAEIAAAKAAMDEMTDHEKTMVAKRLMLEDDFVKRAEEREAAYTDFVVEEQQKRLTHFADFKAKNAALPKDKQIPQDSLDAEEARINADIARSLVSADEAVNKLERGQAGRAQKFGDLVQKYQEQLKAKEAEVTGSFADTAVARFQRTIDEINKLRPNNAQDVTTKTNLVTAAGKVLEQIKNRANYDNALATDKDWLTSITSSEGELHRLFKENEISVRDYVDALAELRREKRGALEDQQGLLQDRKSQLVTQRSAAVASGDPEALGAVDRQLADIDVRLQQTGNALAQLRDLSPLIAQSFKDWLQALQGIASFTHIFDGFGKGLSSVASSLVGIISQASTLKTVIADVNQFRATLASLQQAREDNGQSGGGGVGGFFGALGGGTGTAAMVTGVGVAASVAIGIAGALFASAVKEASEKITSSMKQITDALNDGTINIGTAVAELQAERRFAVSTNSGSKSGRAALDQTLPQLDAQIQQLQNQIKGIRQSFQDMAAQVGFGVGPFADFAKTLFNLQTQTKAYLDTFQQGTTDYNNALKTVTNLFNETLTQAKAQLESNLQGFNQEAVQSAQKVISLLDQQQDLYVQAQTLQENQSDLNIARADAVRKQAEQAVVNDKARLDDAQKILDVEKAISDTIAQAVNAELKVKQQGVLEASQTIAQQKANQISDIRNTASDKLTQLNRSLVDAKFNQKQLNIQIADSIEQYAQKIVQLDRQQVAIDRQNAQLQKNLRLNQIDILNAEQIAALEGQQFDITGDRYALETKLGAIEYAQAQTKVTQWRETASLIDSIIRTGDGVIFNPPPGFPQIKVTIGDIVINNQDNSTNPTVTNPGGNPPPPIDSGRPGSGDGSYPGYSPGNDNQPLDYRRSFGPYPGDI